MDGWVQGREGERSGRKRDCEGWKEEELRGVEGRETERDGRKRY